MPGITVVGRVNREQPDEAFYSFFANAIDYEVPDQNLDRETGGSPPVPKSRFITRNVRRRQ